MLNPMLYILTPSPIQGASSTIKGLGLGKQHTKFWLPSIKGTQVITSKRNGEVNINVNMWQMHEQM